MFWSSLTCTSSGVASHCPQRQLPVPITVEAFENLRCCLPIYIYAQRLEQCLKFFENQSAISARVIFLKQFLQSETPLFLNAPQHLQNFIYGRFGCSPEFVPTDLSAAVFVNTAKDFVS